LCGSTGQPLTFAAGYPPSLRPRVTRADHLPFVVHKPSQRSAAACLRPAWWRAEVVGVNAKDVVGQQGEQVAARFLTEAGLAVLGRNWRCSQGEIDIIALEGRTLVICEVKTRSGVRFGTPLEAISKPKLARLRRLAVAWVRAHGLVFDQIRIDVVGVLRAASGEFSVEHVRGVG